VNGGEVTDSHRHTATSVYFAIQGSGIYTTAEGEQQFMEPGDLLTQPSWTWHGTTNSGAGPAIWFTAMDTSLMQFLDNWQNERYPECFSQPITKPDGFHMQRLGALRSQGALEGPGPFPVKYSWAETFRVLQDLTTAGPRDPFDGTVLEYRNPQDGGPTTPTMSCRIQLLGPGEQTRTHRHTCNTVYHVVRGRGVAKIGRSRTSEIDSAWSARDCFNVPTWHWHRLVNTSSSDDAILFSVSDRPLFEALRLYREES
jgi:gentisate 1,2-dioxygenase